MLPIEAKKPSRHSVRERKVLAGHGRGGSAGGQAVRTVALSGAGGEGPSTEETVLGSVMHRRDGLGGGFTLRSGTGRPWKMYSQSCLRGLRKIMMSATIGWRASIVALAIAILAGGCVCSGTCGTETRLTASIHPGVIKNGDNNCTSGEGGAKVSNADYIVALITDKVQLANVNLPRLLKSSQMQVDFDFMRFFNWSNQDKFVTRSNVVIVPVEKLDICVSERSENKESRKGVILYPDRDPNGMLYIQLVLIKGIEIKDWMNRLVSNYALNGTSGYGQFRLWPLWSDLSAQSDFTATILLNVDSENIVSWNTYSFFEHEDDKYGFAKEGSKQFPLPINGSGSQGLYLEVTRRNPAAS